MTDTTDPNDRGNFIHTFLHCRHCARQKPRHLSPRQWNRTECGITPTGLQVYCLRCAMSVATFTPEQLRHFVENPPSCACCPGGVHVN